MPSAALTLTDLLAWHERNPGARVRLQNGHRRHTGSLTVTVTTFPGGANRTDVDVRDSSRSALRQRERVQDDDVANGRLQVEAANGRYYSLADALARDGE